MPDHPPDTNPCLSARALLIGAVLVVFLCLATAYTDGFMASSELAGCHFPMGPVLLLFALILPGSWLLQHLRAKWGLSHGEKLLIMAMMMVAAGLPTFGLALYLFPMMTAPFYMASAENKWEETFFKFVPSWFAPEHGSTAVRWFYDGAPPGSPVPWGQWAVPLAAWTVLCCALYMTMFSLGSLIRKQWTERENLIYPLVELPVEMILPGRAGISDIPIFRNRGLWIGFAIPFIIHNVIGLRLYFPAIPDIPLHGIPFLANIAGAPWRQLSSAIYIHFSVIGFAFFLTTEISLSLWLFWWFGRLQHVFADCFAAEPLLARVDENQYQGAFLALVAYGLYVARGHLRERWEAVRRGRPHPPAPAEPREGAKAAPEALSPRAEVIGLALGGLVTVIWLTTAGMSLIGATLSFALFLIICWGMARLVVESGILFAKAVQMRPTTVFTGLVGSGRLAPRDITIIGLVEYVFMFDLKVFMMPQILHGLKMGDAGRVNRRQLYLGMAVAVVVGIAASYYASLRVAYAKGALAMHPWFFLDGPRGMAEGIKNLIANPTGVEAPRLTALAGGLAFTWALLWLRQNFLWFPLHPIGYVVGNGFEAYRMWFPFLVGWAAKALVMRYGSVKTYRALRAPFLGMVLGEFAAAGLWLVVDAILGRTGHRIFP